MQSKLQAYYNKIFSKSWKPEISNVEPLQAGWESEMYAFDLSYRSLSRWHQNPLILRLYQGPDAQEKSKREYEGMQKLHEARYPVPEVGQYEETGAVFGKPFLIMERIDGQMLWPIWFHESKNKQSQYLTQFCSLFVQLHKLDWRAFSNIEFSDPYLFVDQEIATLRASFARFPIAGFTPLLDWLEERRVLVPCKSPGPIHWDFHPGNILLQKDGAARVIDWTQVSVSDPRFDLGWTLVVLGSHEHPVWRKRILNAYGRISGAKVERIEYFEIFACIKRLFTIAASFEYGPEELGLLPDSLETMRGQLGAFRRVYDFQKRLTSLRIPEVETFLNS